VLERAVHRRAVVVHAGALAACTTVHDPDGSMPLKGRVVLLRGLMNIFSTGMDSLGAKLRDAGWRASEHNHTAWGELADGLQAAAHRAQLCRPLVVVGHSLGGDDAIRLSGTLGARGVEVDMLFTFDPSLLGAVPPGPRIVVNYFQTTGLWGRELQPAAGFMGRIENVPVDRGLVANHFTIDKDGQLHADVLARMNALTVSGSCVPERRSG
jgi:pimeloyl-ACP methyl ester carboxylesterase